MLEYTKSISKDRLSISILGQSEPGSVLCDAGSLGNFAPMRRGCSAVIKLNFEEMCRNPSQVQGSKRHYHCKSLLSSPCSETLYERITTANSTEILLGAILVFAYQVPFLNKSSFAT
jgi:hypothetical protein